MSAATFRLLTLAEAEKTFAVTPPMIAIWVTAGWVEPIESPEQPPRYAEIELRHALRHFPGGENALTIGDTP